MSERRTIQLPKKYLSYSQIQLWKNDKNRYKQVYFDDRYELRRSSVAMDYGKVVADLLENEGRHEDVVTDTAMSLLPKYDIADKEIRTKLETKTEEVELLIKPDSLDSQTKNFLEYKTGKVPWTQRKAQNHLQLHFYAMGIYLAFGVIPEKVSLVWIETEINDNVVKPTGKITEFPVNITREDVLSCMHLTHKIAKEIELAYLTHVPNLDIINF